MATIESLTATSPTVTLPTQVVPRLESGDRLTRSEFERRYAAQPRLKKAELIEGVVYMGSPVSVAHSEPHGSLGGWLFVYRAATPGVQYGDNGTLRLDPDNEPQPDAHLRIEEQFGGQSRIDEEKYVVGGPELVGEIAASSASYDLHDKLHVYRRNQVQEYSVWRVLDRVIDWFILREGRYDPLAADAAGIIKSQVFPGLWLDPAALLRGDMPAVLQQGLASPEHAEFVARLKAVPR